MPQNRLMSRQTTKKKRRLRPSTVIARVLIVFAVTLLLIVIALYGVMLILTHGPSESAKRLFVMSVKETSAGGFLADMCLSRDEVDAILAEKAAAVDRMQNTEQNTDLITIGGLKTTTKHPPTAARITVPTAATQIIPRLPRSSHRATAYAWSRSAAAHTTAL